jgi:archaellum component FlaC
MIIQKKPRDDAAIVMLNEWVRYLNEQMEHRRKELNQLKIRLSNVEGLREGLDKLVKEFDNMKTSVNELGKQYNNMKTSVENLNKRLDSFVPVSEKPSSDVKPATKPKRKRKGKPKSKEK